MQCLEHSRYSVIAFLKCKLCYFDLKFLNLYKELDISDVLVEAKGKACREKFDLGSNGVEES